jgi:hypothetical protein
MAQTEPPPAAAAVEPAVAAEAAAAPSVEAPAEARIPAALAADAPVVTYVVRPIKPQLIDTTPGRASFALVGAFASMAAGTQVVADNDIQNPGNDVAIDLARAYATAHGYRLTDTPVVIADPHQMLQTKAGTLSIKAEGAHYVVDVDSPGMNLIYFSLDWGHFDLMYIQNARVVDTTDNRVVANAKCFLKPKKTPEARTHGELMADHAAGLKLLIKAKAQQCAAIMKTQLKL